MLKLAEKSKTSAQRQRNKERNCECASAFPDEGVSQLEEVSSASSKALGSQVLTPLVLRPAAFGCRQHWASEGFPTILQVAESGRDDMYDVCRLVDAISSSTAIEWCQSFRIPCGSLALRDLRIEGRTLGRANKQRNTLTTNNKQTAVVQRKRPSRQRAGGIANRAFRYPHHSFVLAVANNSMHSHACMYASMYVCIGFRVCDHGLLRSFRSAATAAAVACRRPPNHSIHSRAMPFLLVHAHACLSIVVVPLSPSAAAKMLPAPLTTRRTHWASADGASSTTSQASWVGWSSSRRSDGDVPAESSLAWVSVESCAACLAWLGLVVHGWQERQSEWTRERVSKRASEWTSEEARNATKLQRSRRPAAGPGWP